MRDQPPNSVPPSTGTPPETPDRLSRTRERLAAALNDRYRVLDEIDRGGMAFVYLARELKHDRDVAIKVLRPELTSAIETSRFLREIHIASRLRHPHILPIYDSGEAEGLLFYVMPLMPGETLRERLDREGRLEVAEVFRIARDVASALDYAHGAGVVHRDVKPENIFLEGDEALLGDFGIAVGLGESLEAARFTRTGASVGTPRYMSPEQAAEPTSVDHRSDIFSFGVVLYECVTGRLPFEDRERGNSALGWIADEPGELGEECPEELAVLIRRCLRVDPDHRLPEDGDLADAVISAQEAWTGRQSGGRGANHTAVLALGIVLLAAGAVVVNLARGVGGEEMVATHEAVVTWSSQETEGRARPGFDEISFLSNREAGWHVWVIGLDRRGERRVTRGEQRIASHVWSPDGRELAYLITSPGGRFLEIADEEGAVQASVRLPGGRLAPRLVRWVGESIFLLLDGELWSVDPTTGTPRQLTDRTASPTLINADVRPRGERLVFAAAGGGASDLWTANLDGTESERLTDDPYLQSSPCWLGPEGEEVVHLSNRGGQVGVWRLDPSSRSREPISTGAGAHVSVDCAAERRLIVVEKQEERADLWLWDPASQRHVQLTSDSRQDFWPSVSEDGRVVFQRTKPRLERGDRLFDADILTASLVGERLEGVEVLVEDGFSPWISPDGRWVAYLSFGSPDGPEGPELRLRHASGEEWLITERFQMPAWKQFPLDWETESVAWAPGSDALYYLARSPAERSVVWRARLTEDGPVTDSLVAVAQAALDLSLSPDGRHLSYVVRSESRGSHELRVLSLDRGAERTLHSDEIAETLYSAGWVAARGPIVVLQSFAHATRTHTVAPVLVGLDGSATQLSRLTGAIAGQARLGPGGLLVPRMSGDSLTLWEHPLSNAPGDEGWTRQLEGIPFDGLETDPWGRLLYSRHEVNHDIWKISFDPSPPT